MIWPEISNKHDTNIKWMSKFYDDPEVMINQYWEEDTNKEQFF